MNYDHLLRADVTYREVRATLAQDAAGASKRDINRCARLLKWKIRDYMKPKDMGVHAGRVRVIWEVHPIDNP